MDKWTKAELRRTLNAALIADAPRLARMAEAGEEVIAAWRKIMDVTGNMPYRTDAEERAGGNMIRAIADYEEAGR